MKNYKSLAEYEKDRFGYVDNSIKEEQPKSEQKKQ